MKCSVVMLICLLLLIPTFALAKQPIRIIEGIVVTKVFDGDTINVTDDLRKTNRSFGPKNGVRSSWSSRYVFMDQ